VKRLTLHIGVPKTGSTTLQTALLENWDVLLRRSCDYISAPQSAGIGRHSLAWEYDDDPRFNPGDGTWEEAREHIDASPNAHFVYSSEVLSRLSPEAIDRVRAVTDGLDVQVVMFVRNHVDIVESWWSSRPRQHWDGWLENALERSSLKFYSTYSHWAETFGADNVVVIPHETTDDVVDAFFRAAGLDELLPELRAVAKRGKVSLHPHFWRMVEEIERVLEADAEDRRRLREILVDEGLRQGMMRPPRGSLLGPRAPQVMERFAEEVEQLNEHVVRLPDVYFVPPDAPPVEELSAEELREGSIRLLGARCCGRRASAPGSERCCDAKSRACGRARCPGGRATGAVSTPGARARRAPGRLTETLPEPHARPPSPDSGRRSPEADQRLEVLDARSRLVELLLPSQHPLLPHVRGLPTGRRVMDRVSVLTVGLRGREDRLGRAERDVRELADHPVQELGPGSTLVDPELGDGPQLLERPFEDRMPGRGGDHRVVGASVVPGACEEVDAVSQERVDRAQAFDIRVDVHAAEPEQDLEPDDVRALGRVPQALVGLLANEVRGQVLLRPEAHLPVRMVLTPGLAVVLELLWQGVRPHPDLVENPGDHAAGA
jgi:hypothetical protein